MKDGNEFQSVTVSVPNARLGEFHVMFGQWLTSVGHQQTPGDVTGGEGQAPRYWGTDPKDADNARVLWEKLSDPARALMRVLMDTPGVWVDADTLASHFGDDRYKVAGYLGWPGRYSAAMGMHHPVRYRKDSHGNTNYRITPEVADLFRSADQKEA
jgi:hypothetical protein